jgi:hypothetical protein
MPRLNSFKGLKVRDILMKQYQVLMLTSLSKQLLLLLLTVSQDIYDNREQ